MSAREHVRVYPRISQLFMNFHAAHILELIHVRTTRDMLEHLDQRETIYCRSTLCDIPYGEKIRIYFGRCYCATDIRKLCTEFLGTDPYEDVKHSHTIELLFQDSRMIDCTLVPTQEWRKGVYDAVLRRWKRST